MRFNKNLIKVIFIYLLIFIVLNIIFGFIYYELANQYNAKQTDFLSWWYFAQMNFAAINYGEIIPIKEMRIVIVIQYLIVSILLPVLTGIIFYFILNRPPRILFPDKLIIRKRTSDGCNGLLTLSVKIANKNTSKLYDLNCQLIYFYYKNLNNTYTRNGETKFSQTIPYIEKTFRFSFELNKFPKTFLESVLDKNEVNQNGKISILIFGKFGKFGDSFMVEKDYFLKDIEFAKDSKLLYEYIVENQKIKRTKICYPNLNELIYYSEDDRTKIVNEIKEYIQQWGKN